MSSRRMSFLPSAAGVPDLVKLLDFGLVKAVGSQQAANLSSRRGRHGHSALSFARSNSAARRTRRAKRSLCRGAVGYYLLTGAPVFTGKSVVDLLMHHVSTAPNRLRADWANSSPPSSRHC